MTEDSTMMRVSRQEASIATGRLWRIAILTAAAAIGTASEARAALYYWSDFDPGYYQPEPTVPKQRPKVRRHQAKKIEAPARESTKPQGPLIIAISIQKQKLKIYDANGFFAETPISTGMRGHPTPMGLFSVIQKRKLHHSNIYSGAPMPYMQRITWSGVAMHAGVLPGYPASHGCIRMPTAFAIKMWNWTKMGARVVITPGDMTPATFSHALLATQKVAPRPAAANEPQPNAPPAAKADKAANPDATAKPAISDASPQLRATVGHNGGAKPVMDQPSAPARLHEQGHTADASGNMLAAKASITVSDATQTGSNASPRDETAASTVSAPSATADVSEAAKSEGELATAKSSDPATAETNPAGTKASDNAGKETDASVKAVTDISPSAPDEKIDQTGSPDTEGPAASKPDPTATAASPKRTERIAVFISRKDSKLYVRQNFAPLFDVPVTIAPSDRPLGTHVFTARVDKDDANVLHWSVISLPVRAGFAERRDEDERVSRRRKIAGAGKVKASPVADSAAEALDRLTIPADAMARITEALSTGGSIIVSDQGISGGETGEGTDFVVSLR
jgi:lipoprotein-anchoring transpeptidase ErfK/SrfK